MKFFNVIMLSFSVFVSSSLMSSQDRAQSLSEELYKTIQALRSEITILSFEIKKMKNEIEKIKLTNVNSEKNILKVEKIEKKEKININPNSIKRNITVDTKPGIKSDSKINPLESLKKAEILINQSDFEEAKKTLEKALEKKAKSEVLIQINYWLGEIYNNQKQFEKASHFFASAANEIIDLNEKGKKVSKGPEIFLKLAQSLKKAKNNEDSKLTIAQAEVLFKDMPENINNRFDDLKKQLS